MARTRLLPRNGPKRSSEDGSSQLNFASTLQAVQKSSCRSTGAFRFPRFSSLPAEIRIAIWTNVLPDPEAEPPAVFSQARTWRDDTGILELPDEYVPISMTTACAALLHVNREARNIVLSWSESNNYELCYRQFFCDPSSLDDDELQLPVQGPIFVRPWDSSRDILHVQGCEMDRELSPDWGGDYLNQQLENVQHIAFRVVNLAHYLESRWFYQLLAAMPDLRSISFETNDLLGGDGDAFRMRDINAKHIVDPRVNTTCHSEDDEKTIVRIPRLLTRWEAGHCAPGGEADLAATSFKNKLMEGYLDIDYWPPVGRELAFSSNNGSGERTNSVKLLERLPPWLWDHDRAEFAFQTSAFHLMERRGYNDVANGLVIDCNELYDW